MNQPTPVRTASPRRTTLYLVVAWLLVSLPLAWGVYETFVKSLLLFR